MVCQVRSKKLEREKLRDDFEVTIIVQQTGIMLERRGRDEAVHVASDGETLVNYLLNHTQL